MSTLKQITVAGVVRVTGMRVNDATIKTRSNRFENVVAIVYTIDNLRTGESVTYAHIETMRNTLPDVYSFIVERAEYVVRNGYRVSWCDVVVL